MSARCQLTGRAPSFGKSVPHSHQRTSRRFDPNIQVGIEKAVAVIRARGEKV